MNWYVLCCYLHEVNQEMTYSAIKNLKILGDDVLREVMKLVVFGITEPHAHSLPPSFGYPAEDFAHAVISVSQHLLLVNQ